MRKRLAPTAEEEKGDVRCLASLVKAGLLPANGIQVREGMRLHL
jgi:hypothetical protein